MDLIQIKRKKQGLFFWNRSQECERTNQIALRQRVWIADPIDYGCWNNGKNHIAINQLIQK